MALVHPPVPVRHYLEQAYLQVGAKIIINGSANLVANNFEVNLEVDNGDKALHFNPRFSEKAVIRNAVVQGQWGPEERHGAFPFSRVGSFDLEILVQPEDYRFTVNGSYFGEFKHRIPTEYIKFLTISGDLSVNSVRTLPAAPMAYPSAPPAYEEQPAAAVSAYPYAAQPTTVVVPTPVVAPVYYPRPIVRPFVRPVVRAVIGPRHHVGPHIGPRHIGHPGRGHIGGRGGGRGRR